MEMEDPHPAKLGLRTRRRRQACVWFTVAALLAIFLVIIILVLTVFKARSPVTTINSVSVSNLNVSFRGLGGGIPLSFNLILAVNASVRNPNRVGIKYSNTSALLDYKGENVGEAPIPAGDISAGETMPLNLILTIMGDRFLSKSQALLSDVIAGTLPLTAHTSVTGKVTILRFIHIRVVSHSTCNFNVSIANMNISDSSCSYKTKL